MWAALVQEQTQTRETGQTVRVRQGRRESGVPHDQFDGHSVLGPSWDDEIGVLLGLRGQEQVKSPVSARGEDRWQGRTGVIEGYGSPDRS